MVYARGLELPKGRRECRYSIDSDGRRAFCRNWDSGDSRKLTFASIRRDCGNCGYYGSGGTLHRMDSQRCGILHTEDRFLEGHLKVAFIQPSPTPVLPTNPLSFFGQMSNWDKITLSGQIADSITGVPLVGATIEAEITNESGYPMLQNDPGSPRSAPVIVDQGVTGPNGWYSLDVTIAEQGILYPVRVSFVSADGTRTGRSAILQGQ
jgi:hypothetical protein